MEDAINETPAVQPATRRRTHLLILCLAVLAATGSGLLAWKATRPAQPSEDMAKEAKDYLRKHKVAPLFGSLQKILANPVLERTQVHALLNEQAPDFELADPDGKIWKLKDLLADGPVVLIFYYGYHCNHCVSQLFDINEDQPLFREVGGRVVAISADPPELTRQRFKQYGPFGFPVLSDPGNQVAQAYRVFTPARDGKKEDLLHGTFVIDPDGVVQWANVGDAPFSGNPTLLYHLARLANASKRR
jgi:peroxiredoxin